MKLLGFDAQIEQNAARMLDESRRRVISCSTCSRCRAFPTMMAAASAGFIPSDDGRACADAGRHGLFGCRFG